MRVCWSLVVVDERPAAHELTPPPKHAHDGRFNAATRCANSAVACDVRKLPCLPCLLACLLRRAPDTTA